MVKGKKGKKNAFLEIWNLASIYLLTARLHGCYELEGWEEAVSHGGDGQNVSCMCHKASSASDPCLQAPQGVSTTQPRPSS